MEAHFTFFKRCVLCWTFPTKPGLPSRIHTQSSKHGSCPIRKGKMLGRMLGIMFHRKKKTIFGTEIFSLLKSLHRKYRFGKFLGLARGRAMNGSKVLGKPTVKYLDHTFSLTWKLTSPCCEKICVLCWTFPTKPGLPARIHTQSSKHGSCPIRKGKMLGRMLGIMLHRKRKQFLERIFFFIKVSS